MGKWGKWVLLLVVAMAFAMPAWAVDFKLGGKYEIQGRYYAYPMIMDIPDNLTFPVTDMYLKHYFNLYPQIIVNDKIKIVGDLEVFDNKISRDDEVNWDGIYQAYSEFVPTGAIVDPSDTGSKLNTRNYKPYSQYNTFTVDQLYADVTTGIGKFIAGKTKDFTGIGWFIQVPAAKDWVFGVVWNKKQELGTAMGTKNSHNTGDQDEFEGIAKLENANTLFDFRLAYKYSGPGHAQTRIIYPHLWFNQKFNDLVKMNLKLAYGNGPLLQTGSPVGSYIGAETDWKADNVWGAWLGFGITPGNAAIQIDGAYLPGAKKPQFVSAYLDDGENLDTWLMNDVHDIYAYAFETYATQAALGDPRIDGNYSFTNAILGRLNLAYKFTDKLKADVNFVIGQKENTKYLENWYAANSAITSVNEDGSYNFSTYGLANAVAPTSLESKIVRYYSDDDNNLYLEYAGPSMMPGVLPDTSYQSSVSKDLGWEVRGRLNYQWMDNLSFGIDLAYYKPGNFYKELVENAFREVGSKYLTMQINPITGQPIPETIKVNTWNGTGKELKDTYAARWIAKVTF
jgi:hypothetical protein